MPSRRRTHQDAADLRDERPLVDKSPAVANGYLYVSTLNGLVAIEQDSG